jgi:hypothetical protein
VVKTVLLDVTMNALLGALLGRVGTSVRSPYARNEFVRLLRALLLFEVFVFLPAGAWFYFAYPAWSWSYLVPPAVVPPSSHVLTLTAYPAAAVAGLTLVAGARASGRTRLADGLVGLAAAMLAAASLVFARQTLYVGSFTAWLTFAAGGHRDAAGAGLSPLWATPLAPALAVIGACVTIAAARLLVAAARARTVAAATPAPGVA